MKSMPNHKPLYRQADLPNSVHPSRVNEMLREFQHYLFVDYLPFLDQHIYDREEGGFLWNSNYRGEIISTDKRTWYDARGAWVYAQLYQQLQANPLYLERASQTLEFLMNVKQEGQLLYPWSYDRRGNTLAEREGDLYGNLFVAEACIAYADAASEPRYRDRGRALLLEAFAFQQQPAYRYLMDYAPTDKPVHVQNVLGHWMIFLRISTGYLRSGRDTQVEEIAATCVQELTQVHYREDCGLMLEVRVDKGNSEEGLWNDFVYLGHAIESLWMLMDEALRLGDTGLFDRAATRFKKHVEVAWDPIYGGFFHALQSIQTHQLLPDKVLWAQHEALMGCLLLWRHNACPWAAEWSVRIWDYLLDHYPLTDLPYRPWRIGGDRRLAGHPEGKRIENYHHPRLLMAGIGYLEEINKQLNKPKKHQR